jgi:hypothetical protein
LVNQLIAFRTTCTYSSFRWRWHVLQPPKVTHECNHKNSIFNHVIPRISNFMNLKLYLIFIHYTLVTRRLLLGESAYLFLEGVWIKYLYLISISLKTYSSFKIACDEFYITSSKRCSQLLKFLVFLFLLDYEYLT